MQADFLQHWLVLHFVSTHIVFSDYFWPARTWGFHASSFSSFFHYHKNYRASSLDHYRLDGHPQIHLNLGQMTGCGDSEGCLMPYHKNVFNGHHIRALWNWREKSNTWRGNGPLIYATHSDPYIQTVNYGLTNHLVCCIGCSVATALGGWNTLYRCGWRWALCTRMVIFHKYGYSTPCALSTSKNVEVI